MKNVYKLFGMLLSISLLASCSQSEKLAATETGDAPIRYHKVYEGNKIIYKKNETTADEPLKLAIEEDALAYEMPEEVVVPLPENPSKEWESIRDRKMTASRDNRALEGVKLGSFFEKFKEELKAEKPEKTTASDGVAVAAFVLTVAGFVFLFIPVGAIVLIGFLALLTGFILSFFGLSSSRRGLAIAALVIGSVGIFVLLLLLIVASSNVYVVQ